MKEIPNSGRWVALPILGGVLLGLIAIVCSLLAVYSAGLAAEVLIVIVGFIVVLWLVGGWLTRHGRA